MRKSGASGYKLVHTMKAIRLLVIFLVISNVARAQSLSLEPTHQVTRTITIRLLNAETAKPMGNKMVTFVWDVSGLEKSEIKLDERGAGIVFVPAGSNTFMLLAGPKVGEEPYRIPYIDCNEGRSAFIQVSLVLETGYVPGNECGHKSVPAGPGQVVFWALPKPWWQPDFQ
jgi:hypothetical protein